MKCLDSTQCPESSRQTMSASFVKWEQELFEVNTCVYSSNVFVLNERNVMSNYNKSMLKSFTQEEGDMKMYCIWVQGKRPPPAKLN
jgi:hypothetical protein